MWLLSWLLSSGQDLYPCAAAEWVLRDFSSLDVLRWSKVALRCVPHGILWRLLQESGIPSLLFRAIRPLYNQSRICAQILDWLLSSLAVPYFWSSLWRSLKRPVGAVLHITLWFGNLRVLSWFCWHLQTMTFSVLWGSFQLKCSSWDICLSPRLRFSTGGLQNVPFGSR